MPARVRNAAAQTLSTPGVGVPLSQHDLVNNKEGSYEPENPLQDRSSALREALVMRKTYLWQCCNCGKSSIAYSTRICPACERSRCEGCRLTEVKK
ncbi:hypothetical protein BU23DRAFT_556042 [Bimuria novae-zelandiae CBS 107.79]|uniref:Uncharacterized protein n=1 Tax=Bimuria novae-zelandiae CBS 107.79 TaxID=1447943 RepID=A0A6A5V924_9PLEO|nr:hypothetical protein BU23DRAFT_556042 [Bimuria novae-zelandiae CBS 107.79]